MKKAASATSSADPSEKRLTTRLTQLDGKPRRTEAIADGLEKLV